MLTTHFNLPMIVQRKLQVKYGKQTPNIDSIKVIFQRLYKTNRITNRHCFKKTFEKYRKKDWQSLRCVFRRTFETLYVIAIGFGSIY